jgi:hypothetical protein
MHEPVASVGEWLKRVTLGYYHTNIMLSRAISIILVKLGLGRARTCSLGSKLLCDLGTFESDSARQTVPAAFHSEISNRSSSLSPFESADILWGEQLRDAAKQPWSDTVNG